ncbi:hypothetical protein [Bifidobacterium ramosum]|uniref:Uncharacterized protein n=1 Tax=Bifidobacterium ramosum TaxID=1798158 RepID=A0A7K3TAA8_9BIFI|nr:hypothetical protein [Bifidobacterium ramosum]NEG71498.1 hypothetical protein [Bifidobacterium ramosum]
MDDLGDRRDHADDDGIDCHHDETAAPLMSTRVIPRDEFQHDDDAVDPEEARIRTSDVTEPLPPSFFPTNTGRMRPVAAVSFIPRTQFRQADAEQPQPAASTATDTAVPNPPARIRYSSQYRALHPLS